MKKYYRQGSSIFEFDFDTQQVVCVTENAFNKGIVISDGAGGPFGNMANSFSSSISEPSRFGEPTLESSVEEFQTAFTQAYQTITSASLTL
jgi:hypothetical protein